MKILKKSDLKEFAPESEFLNVTFKIFWQKSKKDFKKVMQTKAFKKFVELLPRCTTDNAGYYDISDYNGEDIHEVPLLACFYLSEIKEEYTEAEFKKEMEVLQHNCTVVYG